MCYNIVQYVEYDCSHQSPTRRQTVDCNDSNCRFSGFHQTTEHNCSETCAQSMLPDQGLVMDATSGPCPSCGGTTNGH
ncbi:hypothetical protein BV22DRAFT_1017002 [Leucogyrophana mollusca]|uniref:Uncharacterized protein n=1 Tax=Leucogyrophana mollusca TaxID=85980 RepID=A0ACB8BBD8_9AGAM|nr:hypothetical protein BV22DRAFT_1017002 [Leucogyrophana mollusca]